MRTALPAGREQAAAWSQVALSSRLVASYLLGLSAAERLCPACVSSAPLEPTGTPLSGVGTREMRGGPAGRMGTKMRVWASGRTPGRCPHGGRAAALRSGVARKVLGVLCSDWSAVGTHAVWGGLARLGGWAGARMHVAARA